MTITPKQLVTKVYKLVSLPEVYFRVNELLDDPHSNAADLGEVIQHDPGLATRLLRIANSAFYGFPSKIETLSRAITMIGTQDLRDLVLGTVAVDTFNKISTELVDMSTFWHHSVYCGLIARLLARQCRILHTERIFVAGLLHDVGQLVIYHEIPELARKALASAEATDDGLYHAEQQTLGFNHGDVGAELFNAWDLPAGLQAAAKFHHEPSKATDFLLETALVHLANSAANRIEPCRNILECAPVQDPEAWRRTELSEDLLDGIEAEATEQFLDVIRIISPDAPLI